MPPSTSIDEFRRILQRSKSIVAIAGAGLSAASGIPTFRDAGGLWKSHDPLSLATPQAFSANPSRVWQFYHMRRETALKASPNAAHLALAVLSIPAHLRVVAPLAKFTLVTQNVDGLSVRALQEVRQRHASDDDPSALFEMHGRVLDTVCTACNHRENNTDSPLCPALGNPEAQDVNGPELQIPEEDLPRCRECGGLLRPGVVWFEEVPHHLKEIGEVVDEADLCLVIGTSSTVYPAAGYAYDVAEHGGKVAIFNLQRSEGDEEADFLFLGPCEETLSQILFS